MKKYLFLQEKIAMELVEEEVEEGNINNNGVEEHFSHI